MTTTNVVLRQAPGPDFGQVGVIPAGSAVAIDVCFDEGAYCAVTWDGVAGFVAGDLVAVVDTDLTVLEAEAERWQRIRSAPRAMAIPTRVAAWGDSLTAGTGASSPATSYTAVAQSLFSPFRRVEGHGFGGSTSSEVKAEFLAARRDSQATAWIWVGRNNYQDSTTVLADIDEMVGALGHERYLVGSVLNGDYPGEEKGGDGYARIVALNQALSAKYDGRFVDIRGALMAAADPVRDAADIAADRIPQAFRVDNIHLNDEGYRVVAKAWEAATVKLGF